MSGIISVSHVTKRYKQAEVLKDVSCEFEEGRIHGLIGRNGSGKTMLLKCICGFIQPTDGEITVRGKKLGKEIALPPDVGAIIETPGFLSTYSAYRNLSFLAGIRGRISREDVYAAIRQVGLDPKDRKRVGKYSMGMKQRLGIAQAIMEDPSILILDEPFNGLDNTGVKEMRELLKSLRDQGKTILLASHNATDIDILCDTVREMDAGRMAVVR